MSYGIAIGRNVKFCRRLFRFQFEPLTPRFIAVPVMIERLETFLTVSKAADKLLKQSKGSCVSVAPR
jgi:hypothetical protein